MSHHYYPGREESVHVRFSALFRLPFELGFSLAVELLARMLLLAGIKPATDGRMPCNDLAGRATLAMMHEDPTAAFWFALQPLLPGFRCSICEGARTAADSQWSTYETLSKDAQELLHSTKWSRAISRGLRGLAEHMRFWQTLYVRRLWSRVGGARLLRRLHAMTGKRAGVLDDNGALVKRMRQDADAAKAIFQAGKVAAAVDLYLEILEMCSDASGPELHCFVEGQTATDASEVSRDNMRQDLVSERTRILVNVAVCQKKLRQLDKVMASTSEVLSSDPRHVKALLLRGTTQLDLGDIEEATQSLRQVLAVDPGNSAAKLELNRAKDLQKRKEQADARLPRAELLTLLQEMAHCQSMLQEKVSALAEKLISAEKDAGPSVTNFLEGHRHVLQLGLPKDPLEGRGIGDEAFQQMLREHEEDEEVNEAARKMLIPPASKGCPDRAKDISTDRIVEIHQHMVGDLQKILDDVQGIPKEQRASWTKKDVEATAELLVSMAVLRNFDIRSEDVEQAVAMREEELQGNYEFASCSEVLGTMMQDLAILSRPAEAGLSELE